MPCDGITVDIMGDYGPFSRMGKSIGYLVTIGESRYLVDLGAPLFQQIGGHGLKHIKGLIATHAHEDHKRWFTDFALFKFYAPDFSDKVRLITSEHIHEEFVKASGPALNTSLSPDSKRVVDISYGNYVDKVVIGPLAKYRIAYAEGAGKISLRVVDSDGLPVGSEKAKVVINPDTSNPRMLFRDAATGEWVEPESYYPFSSEEFYAADNNALNDEEGFTIEAVKSPVWHGVTTIGIKFSTSDESLIFSSDTVHDVELWKELYLEKRHQNLNMSKSEFIKAAVIYGDINDYIERTWSRERYEDALKAFEDSIVIHDISAVRSIVHTDYARLSHTTLKKDKAILTHSPDRIVSEWVLGRSDKVFKIKGDKYFEIADGNLYEMDADIYFKNDGDYFVGYKNPDGKYCIYENNGLLLLSDNGKSQGRMLYRVDLYHDISGGYFPKIDEADKMYHKRFDGRVEIIHFNDTGSHGKIIENQRKPKSPLN